MDLTGTECVYVYMETPDSGKTPVTGSPDRGIREIAEEVGLNTFSAHSIVTEDLAMKRVSAKFVPKLLTAERKQLRVEVSQDMLDSTVTPTS